MATNLKDFGNFKYGQMVKMADVEGKKLTINAVDFSRGQFGGTAALRCVTDKGELITVITGSALIYSAMEDVKAKGAFPVEATFVKVGKMWSVK